MRLDAADRPGVAYAPQMQPARQVHNQAHQVGVKRTFQVLLTPFLWDPRALRSGLDGNSGEATQL